jgi:hypothetical protein
MNATPDLPSDANGDALRRLCACGDDLTQSRIIDFCFIFPDRELALSFVRDVADQAVETCLSWYRAKSMWEVIVKRDMIPDHGGITETESALTVKAERVGGKADGWGCMTIPRRRVGRKLNSSMAARWYQSLRVNQPRGHSMQQRVRLQYRRLVGAQTAAIRLGDQSQPGRKSIHSRFSAPPHRRRQRCEAMSQSRLPKSRQCRYTWTVSQSGRSERSRNQFQLGREIATCLDGLRTRSTMRRCAITINA